jgi:dipeptide/tripeptide permease
VNTSKLSSLHKVPPVATGPTMTLFVELKMFFTMGQIASAFTLLEFLMRPFVRDRLPFPVGEAAWH